MTKILFIIKVCIVHILCIPCVDNVISKNFVVCRDKFYQNKPPYIHYQQASQMYMTDICQQLSCQESFFATQYDTENRIPCYSAYMLDSFDSLWSRYHDWFVEPELQTNEAQPKSMSMEIPLLIKKVKKLRPKYTAAACKKMVHANRNTQRFKKFQAVKSDYKKSKYDKGHLTPAFYHGKKANSIMATNTLTNVAPQDPNFNQRVWFSFENNMRTLMQKHCNFQDAKRFFITGTVKSEKNFIYKNGEKRVNIPDYFWTAVCCNSSGTNDKNQGWSLGVYGENNAQTKTVEIISVDELNKFLTLKLSASVKLFQDFIYGHIYFVDCLFSKSKAETVISDLKQSLKKY